VFISYSELLRYAALLISMMILLDRRLFLGCTVEHWQL